MSTNTSADYTLEHMKMGPRDSYLCFIPAPLDLPPPSVEEEVDDNVTPAHSWSLLQPLSGTCLYVCCCVHSSRRCFILTYVHESIANCGLPIHIATTTRYANLRPYPSPNPTPQVIYCFIPCLGEIQSYPSPVLSKILFNDTQAFFPRLL